MQPGDAPYSVILGLGLMMGPGLALILLIPAWMAFKLNLSQQGQMQVQQALRDRQHLADG